MDLIHFAQSFCDLVSLFCYTELSHFFYTELNHFFDWSSVQSFLVDVLLSHFLVAIDHPIYDFAKLFFIATLLSHFSLLNAQLFFITAVLSHFGTILRYF
jgi:hypothetical protein